MNRFNDDFSSSNRITVTDEHAQTRVHPDTTKLSPFQDVKDIEFEDICDDDAPDLDIIIFCTITSLRSGLDFSDDIIPTDIILTIINSITSQAVTPTKEALGNLLVVSLRIWIPGMVGK